MRFAPRFTTSLLVLAGAALFGCGEPAQQPRSYVPTKSIWVASQSGTGAALTELTSDFEGGEFFDHPWPSDLRLENGHVKLTNYPNPRLSGNIEAYVNGMNGVLDGFSPAAAGYVRFSGQLGSAFIPNPVDTLSPASPVQLIDIDPKSSEYGQRRPVSLSFRTNAGVYYPSNTLAFMPSPGFPLRPHTRYAFVVTDGMRDIGGVKVEKSDDLAEVLGDDPALSDATQALKTTLEPAISEIERAGIPRKDIVQLAVFTTNDPTEELFAMRDHLRANAPVPDVDPLEWYIVATTDSSIEYVGVYGPSPNYQKGTIPFPNPKDGGEFNYDANGEPAIVDTFDLRFSLSVPIRDECPPTKAGYPIALYAHGTGGNFRSYVRDGTAEALAARCIASMGVDQIFHGKREGAPAPDDAAAMAIRFFNVNNVMAARTSNRQSALDEIQRARLFTERHIQVPAELSVWDQPISFNPERVMFFGHSQGGLNGPLFLAADDQALGGVLSGSGAIMSITLTEKVSPEPSVANIVKTVMLRLEAIEHEEVDLFHPGLSLAQMLVDVTDPIHYSRNIIKEPREGMMPKSIYMTVGIDSDGNGDTYSPPRGIEMHAIAMGLPLVTNGQQHPVPELFWPGGPGTITLLPSPNADPPTGVKQNLAATRSTGGFAQWAPKYNSDGHFVVFDVSAARKQADWFMHTLGYRPYAELILTQ
jgi:hypothetical protein